MPVIIVPWQDAPEEEQEFLMNSTCALYVNGENGISVRKPHKPFGRYVDFYASTDFKNFIPNGFAIIAANGGLLHEDPFPIECVLSAILHDATLRVDTSGITISYYIPETPEPEAVEGLNWGEEGF
jgi:hypothetical protein